MEIQDALDTINDEYNKWEITYCENEHSKWYRFESDDKLAQFDRGSLVDGVQIALMLSGKKGVS